MKQIFDMIPNDKIMHLGSHPAAILYYRSNNYPATGHEFYVLSVTDHSMHRKCSLYTKEVVGNFRWSIQISLQWRHNGRDSVSNHQPHDCLFRHRSKESSKLRVTGLCAGIHRRPVNSPHKCPVTRKMFPFDDVIMIIHSSAFYFVSLILDKQIAFFIHNTTHKRDIKITALVSGWCQAISSKSNVWY